MIGAGWNQAVGLTFSPDGNMMFVWEKSGKIYTVINGVKSSTPLLDISQEVGNWRDHGLVGFTVDPNFSGSGGHIYLLYTVDRHHLLHFGTAAYSATTNSYSKATIGRLTRYTVTGSGTSWNVNPASRLVLLGESKSTGVPILHESHGVGSLVFGSDGTLLVSIGDCATFTGTDVGNGTVGVDGYNASDSVTYAKTYAAQALLDTIVTADQNVGAFRSQLLTSLSGKVLRLDPATGNGVPSNPYYDPANPRSARSRTWALGLRNPYRMSRRPDTGSKNPSDGNPGVFYIGDVGWNNWEELNVINGPGQNFGWPLYEGLGLNSSYAFKITRNQTAPNPLGANANCQPYFSFRDLIKQPLQSGSPYFPNPCAIAEQVPAEYRFVHTRPILDWKHASNGPARVGTFTNNQPTVANVGAANSPVSGTQFGGNAATGGVWYTGDDFPPQYKNTYFVADYASGWIRNLQVDGLDNLQRVGNFVNSGLSAVYIATHPITGGIYYIQYGGNPSVYEVRRIFYSGNYPPQAVAKADKHYGPGPLTVNLIGSNSKDPEGGALTYQWDFGDGSPVSTLANPSHTFSDSLGLPTPFNVTLTVTDSQGASSEAKLVISVNNTPPMVKITSPVNNSKYSVAETTTYNLTATVNDHEQGASGLSYQWQTILHHNNHDHADPYDTNPSTTTEISPVGCDGETYYFRIVLTVTDAAGLSATDEVRVYPDCQAFALNVTQLAATAGNAQVTLNWKNPTAPANEIMIVAKPAARITASPSGDGSGYTANRNFQAGGSAFDGGKVVYKGLAAPQTITNLTNATPYFFKVFTRVSTDWSSGEEVSATPSCILPATQASNISFPGVNANSLSLSWVNGNGTGRMVKINTIDSFTNPLNGSMPTASTIYQGSGEQVVYSGNANTVTVTGLSPNLTYFFRVYETNCSGNATVYQVGTASNNPTSQTTSKATPVVSWSNPADITQGTALSSVQLNATASVPGSFTYTPAAGTVLGLGNGQPLSVLFTPSDAAYNTATASVAINVLSTTPPLNCSSTGTLLREFWANVAGTGVSAIPLNTPPTSTSQVSSFEAPANVADLYGARYRGYLCVPTSGNYTFWIAGDNDCELWLSNNDSPAGKQRIAFVQDGFAFPNQWTKYPSQQSVPIALVAGQRYYVEALHKEAYGGDNLQVGWQLPNGTMERPITGTRLSPFGAISNQAPTVSLTAPANNATFPAPANLTLTATAADSDGTIAKVEFYNGATLLATVTASPYTYSWANVAAGSYTLTARATDNQGAVTTSTAVTVTVGKLTPVVSWSNPADITQGTALSSVQLNATASVAGSFTYTPAAGTVLGLGNGQPLSVLFTPSDAAYNTATASVAINVLSTTPPLNCSSTGTLLREFWANVAGTGVGAIPLNTPPTSTSQVSSFEAPANVADLYGARYRGYLCVPTSGNYTFWIAGDNDCELWLSNNDSPAGKQRIAFIQDGFAFPNQWTKYPSQQSSPVALVAGQRYYVEALHKEAYGGDNLQVGWQLPNGTLERPIPGTRLSPFGASGARLEMVAEKIIDYTLAAAPNPFSSKTNIRFSTPEAEQVSLQLYDMRGTSIRTLFEGTTTTRDEQSVELESTGLSNGMYVIRMTTNQKIIHRKIIVSK